VNGVPPRKRRAGSSRTTTSESRIACPSGPPGANFSLIAKSWSSRKGILSDLSGLHCQPTSKSESRIPARRIKTADVSPACLMGSAYGPGPTWKSREGPIADATSRASPIIGLAPRRSGSGCAMYSISRCSSVGGLQAPPTVELPESWVGPSGCDRLGNEIDLASPGGPDNPCQFVGQSYCGAVMTGTSVEFQGPGS